MKSVIQTIEELNEKRTAGEWSYIGDEDGDFVIFAGEAFLANIAGGRLQEAGSYNVDTGEFTVAFDVQDQANARLIVALINEGIPELKRLDALCAELRTEWSKACDEGEKLQERVRVLEEAVRVARDQFSFYAANHRAKDTEDGDKKAETNERLVAEMNKALGDKVL